MLQVAPLILFTALPLVKAFTFNTSTPTQCGQLTVAWTGGTAPYTLLLVPTEVMNHGRIMNISIPSGATGSYSFTLPQPAGLHFLATMYDATGFGSGGTTAVLQVGSGSDASCLNNIVQSDFTFSTDPPTSPLQCGRMRVAWDSQAVRYPLNLYGLIPHGSAFSLPVSQNEEDESYNWTVDIAAGTQFLLLMSDAGPRGTGGSTDLLTVQGGDSSCLNASSPSSAAPSSPSSPSSPTGGAVTGLGGSSGGGTSDSNGTSGGPGRSSSASNAGAVAGGVVGGVLGLALIGLLAFFCMRRRRAVRRDTTAQPALRSYDMGGEDAAAVEKQRGSLDILGGLLGWHRGSNATSEAVSPAEHPLDEDNEQYQATPFTYDSPLPTPLEPSSHRYSATETLASIYTPHSRPGVSRSQSQSPSAGLGCADRISGDLARPAAAGATDLAVPLPAVGASSSALSSTAATAGHAPMQRYNTLYKHRPGSSSNGSSALGAPWHAFAQSRGQGSAVPDTPLERSTTIVQHADAGSVEELPPRYDQLRARNPDM